MTCSNLICCKTGLQYVGGKKTDIAFNSLVLRHNHVANQVVCICCPFYRTLSHQLLRGLFVLQGGWGDRKRRRAGDDGKLKAFSLFPSFPRALSIFRLLLFLLRYTVPIGASAEESVPWVNNAFTLITCLNRGAFCLRMCCTARLL